MIDLDQLAPLIRPAFQKMQDLFLSDMPHNLYIDQYELHEKYSDVTPELWEQFLQHREVATYIENKTASLAEVNARKALRRLSSLDDLSTGDIAAIRELLTKAKLFQEREVQHDIVFSFIPPQEGA